MEGTSSINEIISTIKALKFGQLKFFYYLIIGLPTQRLTFISCFGKERKVTNTSYCPDFQNINSIVIVERYCTSFSVNPL